MLAVVVRGDFFWDVPLREASETRLKVARVVRRPGGLSAGPATVQLHGGDGPQSGMKVPGLRLIKRSGREAVRQRYAASSLYPDA